VSYPLDMLATHWFDRLVDRLALTVGQFVLAVTGIAVAFGLAFGGYLLLLALLRRLHPDRPE
jgi:hypothetical protein